MRQFLTTLMIFPLLGFVAFGQIGGSTEQASRALAAARVADLSARLHFADQAGAERYHAIRDSVTAEINANIDRYIGEAVEPIRANPKAVVDDIKYVLRGSAVDSEYSGPPVALVKTLAGNPVLLVGYVLVRGGDAVNDSYTSLRAYRVENGRFQLTATTGSDFNGYGMFVEEVQSPVANEVWMIAWGPLFGFNGTRDRLRIYAYNGDGFRTVWEPQDSLNASVHVTANGFSVDHLDEQRYYVDQRPPYFVRDEYVLTPDGPRQSASYYLPE